MLGDSDQPLVQTQYSNIWGTHFFSLEWETMVAKNRAKILIIMDGDAEKEELDRWSS